MNEKHEFVCVLFGTYNCDLLASQSGLSGRVVLLSEHKFAILVSILGICVRDIRFLQTTRMMSGSARFEQWHRMWGLDTLAEIGKLQISNLDVCNGSSAPQQSKYGNNQLAMQ